MSDEIIDLTFVLSDLVEINLTDAEIYETGMYDSLATSSVNNECVEQDTPVGKRVI